DRAGWVSNGSGDGRLCVKGGRHCGGEGAKRSEPEKQSHCCLRSCDGRGSYQSSRLRALSPNDTSRSSSPKSIGDLSRSCASGGCTSPTLAVYSGSNLAGLPSRYATSDATLASSTPWSRCCT